jgi:acetolactate synthase-1/2/3 large subunit
MRVSDYIIQFLKTNYNIDTFFTVSGGGCIFLIDSLSADNIKYIATHHEQAASIAAEGYARINNKLGACIVTSGPGGTNAITGVLCSWLDSIPIIVLSGQVNKEMTTNYTGLNLRQLGDQEFNIIESIKNMTKYAIQVNDPKDIRYHLEKACKLATTGRPGPVWIDVPLNVQSSQIEPDTLISFEENIFIPQASDNDINLVIEKINNAKKPLLVVGNGIRLSDGIDSLYNLLEQTNMPTISAVNGNDIVTNSYKYYYGRFGTHAQICANKLIAECDLLLSIGSRLYVRQTGYNFKNFAHSAYKIYVDIDENELNKPTLYPDMKIVSDAKVFIDKILISSISKKKTNEDWINRCDELYKNPKVLEKHKTKKDFVSHYYFIEQLEKHIPNNHHIVTSDGSANVVTMQVLNLQNNQRLITNTGCAPMGYGLPAAIGASVNHNIVCIEGDGSLHLNVHELQTMKHYNLPIKLILLNNQGYLSIKITQDNFFNGKYVASESSSGVTFPEFKKIFDAYEIKYLSIKNHDEIHSRLTELFAFDGPCVCEIFTDPKEYHEPKVIAKLDENGKFIPGKLEDIQWITQ